MTDLQLNAVALPEALIIEILEVVTSNPADVCALLGNNADKALFHKLMAMRSRTMATMAPSDGGGTHGSMVVASSSALDMAPTAMISAGVATPRVMWKELSLAALPADLKLPKGLPREFVAAWPLMSFLFAMVKLQDAKSDQDAKDKSLKLTAVACDFGDKEIVALNRDKWSGTGERKQLGQEMRNVLARGDALVKNEGESVAAAFARLAPDVISPAILAALLAMGLVDESNTPTQAGFEGFENLKNLEADAWARGRHYGHMEVGAAAAAMSLGAGAPLAVALNQVVDVISEDVGRKVSDVGRKVEDAISEVSEDVGRAKDELASKVGNVEDTVVGAKIMTNERIWEVRDYLSSKVVDETAASTDKVLREYQAQAQAPAPSRAPSRRGPAARAAAEVDENAPPLQPRWIP